MAAPLTETPTFDADVIVPEDGVDDETAASLVPAFQSLADRSQWLKAMWTTLLSTFSLSTGSATISGVIGYSGTGRTLSNVRVANAASMSVDVATYRNIYITYSSSTTTTLTFSATPQVGDWFDLYNNTGVTQVTAGIFAMGLLANRGVKIMYDGSDWEIINKWTGW